MYLHILALTNFTLASLGKMLFIFEFDEQYILYQIYEFTQTCHETYCYYWDKFYYFTILSVNVVYFMTHMNKTYLPQCPHTIGEILKNLLLPLQLT